MKMCHQNLRVKGSKKGPNWLTVATVLGVILGVVLGFVIKMNVQDVTDRHAMYAGFVGHLFLNALDCVSIPLIVSSLIVSAGSLDLTLGRRIGGRFFVYAIATTAVRKIT